MPPRIHCVRHAQGYHNLDIEGAEDIRNPELTPRGRDQCLLLRKNFPYHDKVDAVVSSPIRRTIQTALLSMQPAIEKNGLKVILLPEVQETSSKPMDIGADPEVIKERFKNAPVDVRGLPEDWNSKRGKWEPTKEGLRQMALDARFWLKSRPEKEIVLVTHGGLLHYLTNDWSDKPEGDGETAWQNTEFRTYDFLPGEGAEMREIDASVDRRKDEAAGGHKAKNDNKGQDHIIEECQRNGVA